MGKKDSAGSRVVVIAAMIANGVIAVAKFGAAMLTGSSALMSEGMHSVADTGNEALLLLGQKRAKRPPDDSHPFGYGQELYFWSLIVAAVLFGLGGGLSVYEGIHAITHVEPLRDPMWNYIVLGVAFVAEGTSWTVALRHFRRRHRGEPFLQAFRASKDPGLYIPLAEDTAALAGILVATTGVLFSHLFGLPFLDGAASIVIGVILGSVAMFLAWETRGLLVGEAAEPGIRRTIERVLEEEPTVLSVEHVMTMYLSPDEILLNLGLRFHDDGNGSNARADRVNRIERRLREADPRINRIFVEPEGPEEASNHSLEPPV